MISTERSQCLALSSEIYTFGDEFLDQRSEEDFDPMKGGDFVKICKGVDNVKKNDVYSESRIFVKG